MKAKTQDMSYLERVVQAFEIRHQRRKKHPTYPSEELYYKLLGDYFKKLRMAKEEGKFITAHTVMVPTEIFYAMDIVPMQLEYGAGIMAITLNKRADFFEAASGFGFTSDICSVQRLLFGAVMEGALPRPDLVVWSNLVCDGAAKTGDGIMELYGCPGFFLDRPYRYSEEGVAFFVQELEGMVAFLEENTGRKMDWGRLKEAVEWGSRVDQLRREIAEIKKIVPCPVRTGNTWQQILIDWMMAGAPEAVTFFESIRDESQERAKRKIGVTAQEKHRILLLFTPPFGTKLLSWMGKEHGAVVVMEPHISHYGEGDANPDKPLESIARKSFYRPVCRQMHGPVDEAILSDAVNDAIDYQVDGAIYYAHVGCRQTTGTIRIIKDALAEKAGIPTVVVDCDVLDPTFVTDDEMREKLEGFLEILEERK